MEPSVRPLTGREWPAARALLHRALVDEPWRPDRVEFYAGLGYEVFSTFADPAGPDAYSMRRGIR